MPTYEERMAAYRQDALRLANEDNTEKLVAAVRAINNAERIIIGGAAGLSAAGGMDFMSAKSLEHFPQLAKMGYESLWQALWDPNRSRQQVWGMNAAEVIWALYDYPVIKAYKDLLSLVKDKNYFVISTNIDEQFIKAGFIKERVFSPQNSMGHFQCSVPCCRDIWDGEAIYRNIYLHMDKETYACRSQDIPRCPHCGAPAMHNSRDGTLNTKVFIPDMVMKNRAAFEEYFHDAKNHKTLFLELGVGFNSPGLIRHPFQRFTRIYPDAMLIRMNMEYPTVPDSIKDRSIEIGGDIGQALEKMAAISSNSSC